MAQLDQRLTGLIEALLRSPLAELATHALSRLEAAESEVFRVGGDHDPFAPRPGEEVDERAHRQLNLMNEVITERIKLELTLFERSLTLSRELRFSQEGPGSEGLATVMVLDDTAERVKERLRGENLLTGARREGLEQLLNAWKNAVMVTRNSLGGPLRA